MVVVTSTYLIRFHNPISGENRVKPPSVASMSTVILLLIVTANRNVVAHIFELFSVFSLQVSCFCGFHKIHKFSKKI